MESNERYIKARELIGEKRFAEAKKLLIPIKNESRAKEWISKIDAISTPNTVSSPLRRADPLPEYKSSQPASRRIVTTLIALSIGFLLGIPFGSWFVQLEQPSFITGNCEDRTTEWWDKAEPIAIRFIETEELAGTTGRGMLSPVLLDMQNAKSEFGELEYPECAEDARNNFISAMEFTLEGYRKFQLEQDFLDEVDKADARFLQGYRDLLGIGVSPDSRFATRGVN